jgi:hypothetical protein
MSINWPANGEYATPAYQISAMPYLSSSNISVGQVHKYEFPYVTRFISVVNRGANASDEIAVSFTENGLKSSVGNYITLEQRETVREEIRTTLMFISCSSGASVDYQVFCGLTNIPSKNFLVLTGSHGHPGVG